MCQAFQLKYESRIYDDTLSTANKTASIFKFSDVICICLHGTINI